jgi:hypothetical protein
MTDISKCTNEQCPISKKCFRFTAPSNEFRQSYSRFEPDIDKVSGKVECKMFYQQPKNLKKNNNLINLKKMIEVKIKSKQQIKEFLYPKLMISTLDQTIVLMEKPSEGVIIKNGCKTNKLGHYSTNWDMYNFIDFKGSITLQNKLP